MRLGRRLPLLCVLLLAVAGAACDEKLADLAGPSPNLTPTFASIQREIFSDQESSGRLACTQCQIAGGQAAGTGLILTADVAYANLVGRASRQQPTSTLVVPGDAENSYLVKKLEGAPTITGLRMPRNTGPFLTPGQMTILRRWIAEGAANN